MKRVLLILAVCLLASPWLAAQGLVLSRPNQEGWAGVICPNHTAHTDGNPEGRYKPALRAYCCLHSHCVDFDTKTFLSWVAEQGGPELADRLEAEGYDRYLTTAQA